MQKILEVANLFGYGEIREGSYSSTLWSAFAALTNPRFNTVLISEKKDVYPALRKWFAKGGVPIG